MNSKHFISTKEGLLKEIEQFFVKLRASVKDSDRVIELVQHTAKRDKGPQKPPDKRPIFPGGTPLDNNGSINYLTVFDRIQFKGATANNGKRRAAQQFFLIHVDLFGTTSSGTYLLGTCTSVDLIVRGRSPAHYADHATSNAGPRSQAQASITNKSVKNSNLNVGSYIGASNPNQSLDGHLAIDFSTQYSPKIGHGFIPELKGECLGNRLPAISFFESPEHNSNFNLPRQQFASHLTQTKLLPSLYYKELECSVSEHPVKNSSGALYLSNHHPFEEMYTASTKSTYQSNQDESQAELLKYQLQEAISYNLKSETGAQEWRKYQNLN